MFRCAAFFVHISVAYAAAKSDAVTRSEQVLQALGLYSLGEADKKNDIVLYTTFPKGLRVVIGDAIADVHSDATVYSAFPGEISIVFEAVQLIYVTCKGQVFPGEGLVVLDGSEIKTKDMRSNWVQPVLTGLNESFTLRAFIKAKCVEALSAERISSSNFVNLELIKRRYLGIARTIVPTEVRYTQFGIARYQYASLGHHIRAKCSAYVFTELSGDSTCRFHVERCTLIGRDAFRIFINPIPDPQTIEEEPQQAIINRGSFFYTTLHGDKWAKQLSASFHYTLQRLVEIGSDIVFEDLSAL